MKRKRNERGQFHALEVMLIFLGWMLVLAGVWSHSSHIILASEQHFLQEKTYQRAHAQVSTLIEQHHANPWSGCAAFDAGKKRTRTHFVEKSCLQRLASTLASEGIHEVYWRNATGKEIFFSEARASTHCVGIERLARSAETNEIGLLGVISCEE